MKNTVLLLLMLVTSFAFSQTFNQFDENGNRHGKWQKNFEGSNVIRYQGEFSHGKEIGLFKFYKNINGKALLTATRQFNANDSTADVKFYASSGKVISEGIMRGHTYIGVWKYYHNNSNQLMTLEKYNNRGMLEGERFIYYGNGQVFEKSFYKDNKLEGKSIWYSEGGVVIKMYHYVSGELHGEAKFYDNAGTIVTEGVYRRDKKHGIWKYYEDGKLKEEKDFTVRSKNPYKKKKQ